MILISVYLDSLNLDPQDLLIFGILFIIITVGLIFFQIWTIIVAQNARKEILHDQRANFPKPMVMPFKDSNDGQKIGNKVIIGV